MMVLAATLTAFAQPSSKTKSSDKPLTLIPKVGVNYSFTNLDSWVSKGVIEKPDVKGLVGPVAGVELEYKHNPKLGFSAAVLYSMQGRKYDDVAAYDQAMKTGMVSSKKNATISTERHHYINIPLTANYYVVPGLALRAGLQLGVLFHKSGTQDWPYDNESPKHNISVSPNKFDLSIPVGVSYALSNGLQFDLRYNHGLTKISSSAGLIKESNRVIQFSVGYRLNIFK